ncbi:MAG: putative Ig domain-containing protein, partial [Pseudomonadota bacterium]|nr:putative Ig domain-containing protein [Pseudomonadota bacterium]
MVAVFTGSGLGLFQSSLSQLGLGAGGRAALGQSGEFQYVNVTTGNLVLQGQDEQLLGQGLGTDLTRTYNSLGQVGGQIGRDGWLTGFERRVDLTQRKLGAGGSEMTLWTGDGDTVVFRYAGRVDGQHQYVSTDGDGAHDVLRWNDRDRSWTLTEGSTRREKVFADHASKAGLYGRLEIIRDGRTGAEFDVRYDAAGRVAEVRSANGDALVFEYDSKDRMTQVSTRENGRLLGQVSYEYDETGRLSLVTTDLTPEDSSDSAVFWTRYTYVDDTRMRISRVEQSDGVVAAYTYHDDGRIHTATLGDTNTDDTDGAGQTQTFVYGIGTTDVTDSAGRTWTYEFDAQGQLTRVLSPAVNGQRLVSGYSYDIDGNLSSTSDADGRVTSMTYDGNGNLLRQVDGAGNAIDRVFSATNQLLSQATYPSGKHSAQVTRFAYDAEDRLRYTINAAGEVTEHVHAPTPSGETQLSHSRTYLGARFDLTELKVTQPISEAVLNQWASSQDLAKTTRVDLAYDLRGHLSERRSWATVDNQGKGVLDSAAEIIRYSFDAQGMLRQQVVLRGAQRSQGELTSWSYDGMGRLLGSTDALGHASVRVHDDAGQRLAVTLSNGLVRTEVRDRAGQVVAITESAAGVAQHRTTRFHYDAQGRLRASEDASGARSYRFHDDAGRLAGTVDATGAVMAFDYNGSGQVVRTIEYAKLVDTTSWLVDGSVLPHALGALLPPSSADDRIVLTSYDAAGRLAAQVDGAGTTTSYHYDGASRLVRVEVRAADTGTDAPRITRYFHDDAGRQVAALDAEGYLSEWRYDAAGRQTESIRYATATPMAQRTSGSLAALRPLASDGDVHTRNFHNGRGQLVASVDAEGFLTEVVVDEAGNARAELRYGTAVTVAPGDNPGTLRSRAGLARETRTSFDALGQAVLQVNAEGTVTRYSYDSMGLLVKTQSGAGTTEVRENNARYDVFGNLVGELGGEASTRLIGGMSEADLDALYAQYGVRHSYDALGRRTESVDADGNRSWYFYDRAGQLTQTVRGVADESGLRNAAGEVVETRYNAFGQAIETIAYTGRIAIAPPFDRAQVAESIRVLQYVTGQDSRTLVSYDRRGLIAARTDAKGYLTRFAYNAFGELSRETRAVDAQRDVVQAHQYDRLGRLQSSTQDANGIARQLGQSWDAFGRMTSLTDGRGSVTSFEYDRLGRQTVQHQQVSGRAEQSRTSYDAWSRISSQTDALGNTTRYAYDDATRSVVVTTPEQVVLRTERSRHGETIRVRDGLGLETRYEYDDNGQLLRTVASDGTVSTRAYDGRGLLTRASDATGRTVEYRFDAAGRTLARITDPDGLALTSSFAYDGQGRQVATTDPLGVVTRTEYDANGRLVASIQDPNGLALRTSYTWDGLGRQLSVTEGAGSPDAHTVVYAYDGLGRRTSDTVDPAGLGLVTRYAYDGNDNLVRRVDGAGNVTRFVYDEANRPTLSLDGAGGVTRTSYDAAGRLVATRRYAHVIATTGLPDVLSAGQVESRLTPDDARDVQGYRVRDADGRVRFTVDGAGAVVRMDYDDANRLTQTRRHATAIVLDAGLRNQLLAGTIRAEAMALRLTTDQAHDVVSSQVYDAVGRLRFSIDALGAVTESRFDAGGRVVEARAYAGALAVSATMLEQLRTGEVSEGQVTALVAGLGDAGRAQSFVYDAAGRQTHSITRATVGAAEGVGVVQAFSYDAAGRVTTQISFGVALPAYGVFADQASLGAALQAAGAHDAAQQRATHMRFDAAGRLRFTIDSSGAVTEQRFDAVGRLSQSRSHGATLGTVPTSETGVAAALSGATDVRVTAFQYDGAGQLVRTTDALGNSEQFAYDGAGQRTTYTNRDGHRWTYDYDGAGRQVAEHSPPVAVARFDAGGAVVVDTRAVVIRTDYDGMGNVVARTEDAGQAGARTTQYSYDNRGRQIRTTFPDAGRWDAAQNRVVATGQQPTIEILYDALDRAVVHKDVRGFHEYRVLDAAGQLRYEVDQQGYVTAYTYNAFGEQTSLTRHALAIQTTPGQPISIGEVESRLQSGESDRTLTTSYDLRGQKQQIQHGAVDYYDSAGTLRQQRPTTQFSYDSYGQLARESVLLEGDPGTAAASWAHTTRYYDGAGRQALVIDAEGHATASTYSAHGEVVSQTEYARAITGSIDPSLRPSAPAPGDAAIGFDRSVRFEYDALGRRVGEASLHHLHSSSGVASTREVVTAIGYDNEGHAVSTSVDGVATKTAYDALGRVVSVLESERDVLVDDVVAQLEGNAAVRLDAAGLYRRSSPYTATAYDAFGNAVEIRRYADGWAAGQTAPRAGAGDQVHTSRYDNQGRSVWDRDSAGTVHVRRFDAADNILESRYRLDGSEGRWAEVVTKAEYDALGRQTTSSVAREQYIGNDRLQRNGVAVSSPDAQSTVRYNAFGEIVAKDDRIADAFAGARPFAQYQYDNAGRLLASNAEGGNWRSYGYNLAGHQVRESHEVRLASASGAISNVDAVTTSRTDRLGRVVLQVMPSHSDDPGATPTTMSQRLDRWGNVLQATDPLGGETRFEYNERDQAIRQIRAEVGVLHADGTETRERPETSWFYDALGRLVGTRDANGNIRRTDYDASGRVIRNEDAFRSVTRFAYDGLGQQSLTQNALGYASFRSFDRAGQVIAQGDYLTSIEGTQRSREVRESYQLDQNGGRIAVTDALGNTARYDHDSRGLILRSRTAAGVVMSFSYDSQGRKVRETNALSDPSLISEGQPIYRGGVIASHVIVAGQAFAYAVPGNAFTVPTGETPALSVQVRVWDAGQRAYVASTAFAFDSESGTVSGAAAEGIYQVVLVASSSSGKSASTALSLRVVSQSAYDTHHAGDPVAAQGLYNYYLTAGAHFSCAVPVGTFSDSQSQPLTYSAEVWGTKTHYERESNTTISWRAWVPLEISATDEHWLAFDPASGTLSGVARGTAQVRITAHDADGNSVSQVFSVVTTPVGGRRIVTDDEGQTLFLDEQTWEYDHFGRITDHNDLSGADYDYVYDPVSGQLLEQSSDWTIAARSYSTPLDDYLREFERPWLHPEEEYEGRLNLGLPESRLTNDPKRSLSYYGNGQLKEIREGANWTRYAYDPSGNRTLEETLSHDADGQVIHLRTQTTYDAHNRITKVTQDELRASDGSDRRLLELRYSYDAMGNRRRVLARNAYDVNAPVIGTQNQPPVVVDALAAQHVLSGQTWTFQVPAGTFSDPEGGVLQMDATLDDGSALPGWLHFDRPSQTFHGDPPDDSSIMLKVTATDLDGLSVSTQFALTSGVNQPPVVSSPIPAQTAVVGVAWSYHVPAGTVTDPEGRELTYSASLADGSALPTWLHFDPVTRSFQGTAPGDAQLSLRLTATDPDGLSVSTGFTLTASANHPPVVSGAIPSQTAVVGSAWSYQVPAGTFTDPEGLGLTYSATLTDGSALPSWLQIGAGGLFTGTPSATGVLGVRVSATDSDGASVSLDFTLTVEAAQVGNPDGHNLGFELGDVGWDKGTGWTISSGDSFAGDWSAKFSPVGTASITHSA